MAPKKPSRAQTEKKALKPKGEAAHTFLYLLRDPDTQAVRYAGKANDPQARLKTHIRDARRRSTPVYCWIRALGRQGKRPVMSVLCGVEPSQWESAERALISTLRDAGEQLLNVSAGGNEPRLHAGAYLAENGRRTALAVHHGDPQGRRVWELRKLAGAEIPWLEQRGASEKANRLRAALGRLDSARAACP